MKAALKGSVVEIIAGLIMVVGGSLLTVIVEGRGADALGAVFIAMGGLLASYRAAGVYAVEQAKASLQTTLSLFHDQLQNTAVQLTDTVGDARGGQMTPDTCNALMLQSSQTLTELVAQMRATFSIPSSKKASEGVQAETLDRVKTMRQTAAEAKERLEYAGRPEDAQVFAEMESQASEVEDQLTSDGRTSVEVECPVCFTGAIPVEIGNAPGSSALLDCPRGHRFHVHRIGDLSVITRPWGYTVQEAQPAETRRVIRVECPECAGEVPLWISGKGGIEERWCLGCHTKLAIDTLSEEVVETGAGHVIAGDMVGEDSLRCPECNETRSAFAKRDGVSYAECRSCGRLLHASG